jgi:RimJ/RimL family protein N-acetyltransferase
MTLTAGLHAVPSGHVAAVVTYLEMAAPGPTKAARFPDGVSATREQLSVTDYRALFKAIGAPWLWFSRLTMTDQALDTILQDKNVQTWIIRSSAKAIGLVELDFRTQNACELAFFGLVQAATGQGLGGPMMGLAQTQAFAQDITRFHVHTCTLDAPQALGFYQKCGFTAYKRDIEIFADPRLDGTLEKHCGGHIPCLT